jgi:hypothetical protein
MAEIITLFESNYRSPVSALRKIADEIEARRAVSGRPFLC